MRNALVIAMLVVLSASISSARPQKDHKSWFKVVGRVFDGSGRPIQWGRVYIKDSHAHFLKIKPVGHDGRFNVAWLDARLDYEIYAEKDDQVSEKVLISGSQSAAEVVITLKLGNK
jgi:prepilin-type processing-associated H-X9-DG protein